jgi:uncharacterized protein (TIGR00297 family)
VGAQFGNFQSYTHVTLSNYIVTHSFQTLSTEKPLVIHSFLSFMQIFIGLILGVLIAFLAWRVGSLSADGAIAAAMMGGLIFGLGGLPWAALLLTFFISSSLLSRAFKRRKAAFDEKFSKGSRRDAGQVLANGGLGMLLVIAATIWPHPLWFWAYMGAMACVNADTWATEVGVLSRAAPRLITTGQRVESGTSGGISMLGTLAAGLGAALIGLAAFWSAGGLFSFGLAALLFSASAAGVLGALFDSLLGATVQAIYRCPACQKETERYPRHTCGAQTTLLRGWPWLNNDWVNFLSSGVGAIVASSLWWLLSGR